LGHFSQRPGKSTCDGIELIGAPGGYFVRFSPPTDSGPLGLMLHV
jgi:hypothetical protein